MTLLSLMRPSTRTACGYLNHRQHSEVSLSPSTMRGLPGSNQETGSLSSVGTPQPSHLSLEIAMSLGKKLRQHKPVIWTPRPEVLLDPPISVPLSGTAPRVVLGQAWWDEVRREAYRKTDYHCIVCKVANSHLARLNGHERYEIDWLLGRMTYLETVPLCPRCHAFIHPGFLKSQVGSGVISRQEMEDILERGRGILRDAKIERPDDKRHQSYPSIEWQDWRLVVADKEYPPLYESFETFQKAMEGDA